MKISRAGLKNLFSFFIVAGFALSFATSVEAGYRGVQKKWTRTTQLFNPNTMEAKVIVKSTYFSENFRHAFIKEHIRRKYLEAAEAAHFTAKQEKRGEAFEEFFVSLYAPKDYQAFSTGAESFWEVVLVSQNGEEVKPASIEFVDTTPYEEVMFSYIDQWSKGYKVLFPKVGLGKDFQLIFRSVVGKTDVRW